MIKCLPDRGFKLHTITLSGEVKKNLVLLPPKLKKY